MVSVINLTYTKNINYIISTSIMEKYIIQLALLDHQGIFVLKYLLGCNSTSTYVEPVYKLRRLNSASYRRGLSVLLNTKSDDYFVTSDDFVGFKVSSNKKVY